jgi:hypothetical protein
MVNAAIYGRESTCSIPWIGGGYPLATIDWHGNRPESIGTLGISTFESIIKISAIVDGELNVSWGF